MTNQLNIFDDALWQKLENVGDFSIAPCDESLDIADKNRFKKLNLNSEQKMNVCLFLQTLPSVASAAGLSQAYRVEFPQGVVGTLTKLKQGGLSTAIQGANGQFAGSAALFSLAPYAAVIAGLSAVSIAAGNYVLTQIKSEMNIMQQKIDKILDFLYGDKKAELLAEISFAQYAYRNYTSIMEHEEQRIATLVGLQQAKIVAMKDIEFYLRDLANIVSEGDVKDYKELTNRLENAEDIKGSIERAQQLYIISSAMEVYFAQNQSPDYLRSLQEDMLLYIDKCDKRALKNFSSIETKIKDYKNKPLGKIDKTKELNTLNDIISSLQNNNDNAIHQSIRSALRPATEAGEYFISSGGDVYIKC